MPFVGKLRMEHVDGTETYKLLESLIYITRKKEKLHYDWVKEMKEIEL